MHSQIPLNELRVIAASSGLWNPLSYTGGRHRTCTNRITTIIARVSLVCALSNMQPGGNPACSKSCCSSARSSRQACSKVSSASYWPPKYWWNSSAGRRSAWVRVADLFNGVLRDVDRARATVRRYTGNVIRFVTEGDRVRFLSEKAALAASCLRAAGGAAAYKT